MRNYTSLIGLAIILISSLCSFQKMKQGDWRVSLSAGFVSAKEDTVTWDKSGRHSTVKLHTSIRNNSSDTILCYFQHLCSPFNSAIRYYPSGAFQRFAQGGCMNAEVGQHIILPYGTINEDIVFEASGGLSKLRKKKFQIGVKFVSYEMLNDGKHPAKFEDTGFRNEMAIDTSTNMIWSEEMVIK
jgi:hypothetical protein